MYLSELYQYIFGDRAIIQPDSRLEDEEKRRAYIEQEKLKIKKAFEFITDPSSPQYKKFYYMLTSLDNESTRALREIIYSDEEVGRLSDFDGIYSFPDEIRINEKFDLLNEEFKHFTGDLSQTKKDFIEFFKACKLTADFVECNNDNEDEVAYMHAYKLLVLFGAAHGKKQSIFANVNAYFKQHGGKNEKQIHDALVQAIPINDPPLQDLDGWRKLILRHGYKTLGYFQDAPVIEKQLSGSAPKTLIEAEEAASKTSYQRAKEYPELARLCKQYHLSEEIFNRCLEVDKKRKKKDLLPDVVIDGAVVGLHGQPGYHLVKLPVDDPRAYILGEITACCQSIGKETERCVIDGVTREKNGFYVLLKGNPAAPPMVNGEINYRDYKIIGQGYAWLSPDGNMTFDSWENLRPEQDNTIAVEMLYAFGEAVIRQYDDVIRVTIGTGGKTPGQYKERKVKSPEVMAEGYQYGDSRKQGLIIMDSSKVRPLIDELVTKNNAMKEPLWSDERSCALFLDWLDLTGKKQADVVADIFLNDQFSSWWKQKPDRGEYAGAPYLALFKQFCLEEQNSIPLRFIAVMQKMRQVGILSGENFLLMVDQARRNNDNLSDLLRALDILSDKNMLTNENFQLLMKMTAHTSNLALALEELRVRNMLNDQSLRLVVTKAEHVMTVASGVRTLTQAGLLDENYLTLLMLHAEKADKLATNMAELFKSGHINAAHGMLFLSRHEHANVFLPVLAELAKNASLDAAKLKLIVNHLEDVPESVLPDFKLIVAQLAIAGMLSEHNLSLLSKCNKSSSTLKVGVLILQDKNILNEKNFMLLLEHPAIAMELASSMANLSENALLNDATVALILRSSYKRMYLIEEGILILSRAGLFDEEFLRRIDAVDNDHLDALFQGIGFLGNLGDMINREYLFSLIDNIEFATELARSFLELKSRSLLNETTAGVLVAHAQHASAVTSGILTLSFYRGVDLLTETNIRLITANPEFSNELADGIKILAQSKLPVDNYFKYFLEQPQHTVELASGLSRLASSNLINESNINRLVRNAKHASRLSYCMEHLAKANLLDDANVSRFVGALEQSYEVKWPLGELFRHGYLTQASFDLLMQQGEAAPDVWLFISELDDIAKEPTLYSGRLLSAYAPERAIRLAAIENLQKMICGKAFELNEDHVKALNEGKLGEVVKRYSHLLPQAFFEAQKKYQKAASPEAPGPTD